MRLGDVGADQPVIARARKEHRERVANKVANANQKNQDCGLVGGDGPQQLRRISTLAESGIISDPRKALRTRGSVPPFLDGFDGRFVRSVK